MRRTTAEQEISFYAHEPVTMNRIIRATVNDSLLLSELAITTFIESHAHSAPPEDINAYIAKTYPADVLKKELSDPRNIYHIIYCNERAAGFSKIVFNAPYQDSAQYNITKLERIYLLKKFYGLGLGKQLLKFIIKLSKENDQSAIWLYTWKENPKAIGFYEKHGFEIIGSYDFKISETHSNPNHQMLLWF